MQFVLSVLRGDVSEGDRPPYQGRPVGWPARGLSLGVNDRLARLDLIQTLRLDLAGCLLGTMTSSLSTCPRFDDPSRALRVEDH